MGYKKMDQSLGFVDLALASSLKHNRSLKTMEKLDKAINWSRVKEILMNHYTETFEKCSILFKAKAGENFNHRNTLSISRIKI